MPFARLTLTAAAAALPLAASPVHAAPPTSGIETAGAKLDDAALSRMRGKYVAPNGISYFGVQMQSAWQRPDGTTIAATILLSLDFASLSDDNAPQLLVRWSHEGDSQLDVAGFGSAAADSYVTVPGGSGSLGTVQGVVQSQLIAGSDNQVGNAMSIAIAPTGSIAQPNASGMTAIDSSETHQLAGGSELQLVFEGNRVGIAMSGGRDQVVQMLDGLAGQAAQNVVINSSGNSIHNAMGINVGYDPQIQQAMPVSIQNGLTSLKGWGY